MKVGILGGSFNPVHNSHIKIARRAIESKFVDEVWMMPCRNHPLDKIVAGINHRVNMISRAIMTIDKVKLCEIELEKEGTSYTYQTLRELRRRYSDDFYIIIGSDLLQQINRWHGYEMLRQEGKFLVFSRKGYPILNPGLCIGAEISVEEDNISSTKVRQRVKEGKSISDLVPKSVEDYILKKGLYKK
jgi:nicotinate-nucleotide adenylyltransferase